MSTTFEVGQPLDSATFTMTEDRVRDYAEASGDRNPIHLDDGAARAAGLAGRIAHGNLTMGVLGTVATEWAGGVTNVLALRCRFRAMVMLGDEITITGTVTDVAPAVVTIEAQVLNQRGEPVLTNAVVEIGRRLG